MVKSIIGTALGAMNSGLLGCIGNFGRGSALTGAAAGVLGAEVLGRNTLSPIDMKEINDQEFDLWEMGKIREDSLKNSMAFRERDIAEKADIYRQSVSDNNRLIDKIEGLKDFTVKGMSDVYQSSVNENRVLERQISRNQLEAFKNVADLYTSMVKSDKDLEL